MKNNYLDKVVDQIVSRNNGWIMIRKGYIPLPSVPFHSSLFLPYHLLRRYPTLILSSKHCGEVYGLNEEEVGYVWRRVSERIIKDKINNGKELFR